MNKEINMLVDSLNSQDVYTRLNSLRHLIKKIKAGELEKPESGTDVNNHIHTTYSFSPYSPAKAIWMAHASGLSTAGIMDHDTISGAEEFIEAGRIAGIATTIGMELRADFSGTLLNGKRINNPDQRSIAYVALHGVPHNQIGKVNDFFKPYRQYRYIRSSKMTEKLNSLLKAYSIVVDFEKDVAPISNYNAGGTITERHILYALALKIINHVGKGRPLIRFLKDNLNINISKTAETQLIDSANPHYEYDMLGLLKSELLDRFYIDATDECPDIKEILELSANIGAISAYAYLGDVKESVTGDKKARRFEDGYIEELFEVISNLGFNAVTYMPSRNSAEQLDRVRALCEKYSFFQISGEDINSPRQPFVCMAMRDKKFKNLLDSTWALIGHEFVSSEHLNASMFSPQTVKKYPSLDKRINVYKGIGLSFG